MNGMIHMAAKGRKGDTMMAHVTPGELVVPKEVAAVRPDLVAHIRKAISSMGGDPSKYKVGTGHVNPATGVEEFATEAEVRAAYKDILGREPDAGGMAYWQGRDNLNDFRGAAAPEIVSNTYQSLFGRPAEKGGVGYWSQQGAADPNYDYSASIRAGAQGADITAMNDIDAGGVDTSKTWGGGASLTDPKLRYDATNNTWGAVPTPAMTADQAAELMRRSQVGGVPTADFDAGGGYAAVKKLAEGNTTGYQAGIRTVEDMAKYAPNDAVDRVVFNKDWGKNETFYKSGNSATGGVLPPAPAPATTPAPAPVPGATQTYVPELKREVVDSKETIEGRINGLMGTDGSGNYTNQVIRQAHDRAMQGFARRGLLNSSMAQQAGQEAVIAKAIEIAGPDAKTYFEQSRANQDAKNLFGRDEAQQGYTVINKGIDQANKVTNIGLEQANTAANKATDQTNVLQRDQAGRDFTLRQDYQKAQATMSTNFQRQIDTINASNATPEDKSVAIAQAQSFRDGESVYTNNIYSRMPAWRSEWLSAAISSDDAGIDQATSMSYLQNILNDPAQTQAKRDRANVRIQYLRANPPPAPTPAPAPASSVSYDNGAG